jgi:prophage regulatory protein
VTNTSSRGLSSAAAHDSAPSHKLIPLPAVLDLVPVGRAYFYELVRDGKAPRPIKLGKRSLWLEHEVDSWVDELAARRDAA